MAINRKLCCLGVTLCVGLVLVIIGVVSIPVSKNIIDDQIKEQINLNNKDTLKNWDHNPTPIYFQIWVWNITNPVEVKQGLKPSLQQSGPYTYSENRQKVDIKFHDNNTVTYREDKYYSFVREKSVGPESTVFTTVNIPFMLIANVLQNEFSVIKDLAQVFLDWSSEEVLINVSVGDMVWGYDEPLINKTVTILNKFGLKLNISDKFGIFAGTNGTDDGVYNIKTGADDVSQFGIIKNWNYANSLSFWTSDTCNMLNGTDGTIFHPFTKKSDTLYVFSSDLCRSIYFTFLKDYSQKDIPVYRFTTPPEVFMNVKDNPANLGFCTPADNCLDSGLLNVENCHYGAPIIFSQPHFLNAAPNILHGVTGLNPSLEEHGTFIDVEPNTGAAFYAAKKLQVNILLEKVDGFKQTLNFNNTVLPVIWLNESSMITDSLADTFKDELGRPVSMIHIGIWVAIGLGIALAVLAFIVIVGRKILDKRNIELQEITQDKAHLVTT
ncbi:Lysosome membrane protein 2 [Mactra antiquata]